MWAPIGVLTRGLRVPSARSYVMNYNSDKHRDILRQRLFYPFTYSNRRTAFICNSQEALTSTSEPQSLVPYPDATTHRPFVSVDVLFGLALNRRGCGCSQKCHHRRPVRRRAHWRDTLLRSVPDGRYIYQRKPIDAVRCATLRRFTENVQRDIQ